MSPELIRRLMSLEQYTAAFLTELRTVIALEQKETQGRYVKKEVEKCDT